MDCSERGQHDEDIAYALNLPPIMVRTTMKTIIRLTQMLNTSPT
jgi:hypothetical protein